MIEEKKLLYISSRIFWPPMGGHEAEVFHYCRGLHEKYGYTVDVYAFDTEDKLQGVKRPSFINKVTLAHKIKNSGKLFNILFKSIFTRKQWTLQNSLYYSKDNEVQIRRLIEKNQYAVVIVDMIRLATYFSAMDGSMCKKILNIEDTLSKRYKLQLNALTKKTNIAGQYNEKLPVIFQKILRLSFIKKLVLTIEIPRMEKAEKYYADLFDHVIFVSSIETEEFNLKYHMNKAVTVSLGIDYPYFSEVIYVKKEKGKVAFVGNMATAANADSVRLILDRVIPNCKKLKSIVFVGNCPVDLVTEYSNFKEITFTGKVVDLRANVQEGMVFLAPMAYGTGIKTKILEAMAMGMPVVTNSIGAEGIPAIHGQHWYVSDEPEELASYVDKLLESQDHCDTMGSFAKQFVKEHFDWDIIFRQFEKIEL